MRGVSDKTCRHSNWTIKNNNPSISMISSMALLGVNYNTVNQYCQALYTNKYEIKVTFLVKHILKPINKSTTNTTIMPRGRLAFRRKHKLLCDEVKHLALGSLFR